MNVALVFVQVAESEMPSRALSIEALAAHLRDELGAAVNVRLWDLQLTSPAEALEEIAAFAPDVIGASVPISCMPLARDLLPAFRMLASEPLVVIGNLVATNAPEELLAAVPWVVLIRGEGEEPMVELVRRRARGDRSLDGIPGACWIDPIAGPRISPVHVGSVFGGHVVDLWPKLAAAGGQALVESSRGCPARCTFCSSRALHPNGWRRRPLSRLVAELRDLRRAGVSRIFFADDDFVGGGWQEAVQVADVVIATIPEVTWGTAIRADSVSLLDGLEGLKALAERGMRDVLVGIESGSASQLRRFGKRANLQKNALAVRRLRSVPSVNLLAGFLLDPMMTVDEIRDTARFVLDNELWCSISNPLQVVEVHFGTRIAETVEAAGIRRDFDLDTMTWSTTWLDRDAERVIGLCRTIDEVAAPTRKAVQRRYRHLTRRAVRTDEVDPFEVGWLNQLLSDIKKWQIDHMWRVALGPVPGLAHTDVTELMGLIERASSSDDPEIRRGTVRSHIAANRLLVGGANA